MTGAIGRAARGLAWLAAWALAYAGLVLAYVFLVHTGVARRRDRAWADIERLQDEVRNLEVTASKLPEFQAEARRLESTLDRLNRVLPPEPLPGVIVAAVMDLGRTSGLVVVDVTAGPAGDRRAEGYAASPVTAKLRGGLAALAVFADRLARLPRLLHVRSIRLERSGADYAARFELQAFHHVRARNAVPEGARRCERDQGALYAASEVVVAASPIGEERVEVPGVIETVSRYRVAAALKGRVEPGETVVVTRACGSSPRAVEPDGFPPLRADCDPGTSGAAGDRKPALLFLLRSSPAAGSVFWDTPRRGSSVLTCLPPGTQPEGFERVHAARRER